MSTQADVVAALAKRKAGEFEAALDRHAPTKQQLAKAATEQQTATQSLAAAEAKVKPAQSELDGKTKVLAALEERKKKTPEEKKNLDKKIADAGSAMDKAKREIDLAKSEVGFTGENVKTAESNVEKAKAGQAEAGKLPVEREAALAEAKLIAEAWMQDCLDATYSADGSLDLHAVHRRPGSGLGDCQRRSFASHWAGWPTGAVRSAVERWAIGPGRRVAGDPDNCLETEVVVGTIDRWQRRLAD